MSNNISSSITTRGNRIETSMSKARDAYQLAKLTNPNVGTLQEWLDSLRGPKGDQGIQGPPGPRGEVGNTGLTPYESAVAGGYLGTEQQWLMDLMPPPPPGLDGQDGQSAYSLYVQTTADDPVLSPEDWIASLQGADGATGPQGSTGPQGTAGNAANIASDTHAADGKTTPADADEIGLIDSAASWVLKKLTWANLKAALKSYLTPTEIGAIPASGGTMTNGTMTNGTIAGTLAIDAATKPKAVTALTAVEVNNTASTGFTLAASDSGKIIQCTAGTTVTVTMPTSDPGDGFSVLLIQSGAGQIVTAGGTRNGYGGATKTAGQHAAMTVLRVASSTYNLSGNLTT